MAKLVNIVNVVILCCLPVTFSITFYRYSQCLLATPCPNTPTNGLVDDWVLVMATAPAADNILTLWGPTYTACDPNTISGLCSNQGIYYLKGDDNTGSSGFTYGYNDQLEKWTLESFVVNKVTVPNTNLTAYETFYNEYLTVEQAAIFKDGKPTECGKKVTINPMLRRYRWVLLDTDQNQSYRLTMSCENLDGFLYDGYPAISLYVKRSALSKFKVTECKQLAIYETISKVLKNQKIDIDDVTWNFVVQDKLCPNEVVYNSIQWGSCKCQVSGTAASFKVATYGHY